MKVTQVIVSSKSCTWHMIFSVTLRQGIVFSFIIVRVALGVTSDVTTVVATGQGQLSMVKTTKISSSYPPRSTFTSQSIGTGVGRQPVAVNVTRTNYIKSDTDGSTGAYELSIKNGEWESGGYSV
jgi:hypothetical protein